MPLLSRKHHHNSSNFGDGVGAEAHPDAEHGMTEDYVSAGAHAAISQAFRELQDPRNTAALTTLILEQAGNVARQATTPLARQASRISAQEAFTGSYDAVERKYDDWWQRKPTMYTTVFLAACAFLGLLLTGLLLALWRFAVFGLR